MKVLLTRPRMPEEMARRMAQEARLMAQLQHPAIVPVHELGRLEDGRIYFTMPEVKGQTLGALIRELHKVSEDSWQKTRDGWNLHRLVGALNTCCEAMAFSHAHGSSTATSSQTTSWSEPSARSGCSIRTGAGPGTDLAVSQVMARGIEDIRPIRAESGPTRSLAPSGTPYGPRAGSGRRGALGPQTDVFALGRSST